MRHAPTASNAEKKWMGRLNPSCEPFAIPRHTLTQVRELSSKGPFLVRSSPLERALQTAQALGIPYVVDERIVERDLGRWSGRTHASTVAENPGALLPNGTLDPAFTPPEGEPWSEFLARVSSALADYQSSDAITLAVTHNGVIRAMRIASGEISEDGFLLKFELPFSVSRIAGEEVPSVGGS
jgi:broad specificity phosphatase PhoE